MHHPKAEELTQQAVLQAWQAQLADAARIPILRQQLNGRERELRRRFAAHYATLSRLPRRLRRSLQR